MTDYITQLTPHLSASMQAQGYDYILVAIPKLAIKKQSRWITNIPMNELIPFLQEQIVKLQAQSGIDAPPTGRLIS